jgi:hypothetical protein
MKKPSAKMDSNTFEQAARQFDQECEPRFLTPPPALKRQHDALMRKIKRRRGRPARGAGAQRVQITMERSLLSKADRLARTQGISRSELIARCVMPVVSKKSA